MTGEVPGVQARVTRRRSASRRRLIEAARVTFIERGIRDTPVELICERAGFTRGAFYSNFASKEDLFLTVYEEEMAARKHDFAAVVTGAADDLPATADDLPATADDLPATVDGGPPQPSDLVAWRGVVADMVRRYVAGYSRDETWFVLVTELRLQGLRRPELRPRLQALTDETIEGLAAIVEQYLRRVGIRLAVDARYAVRAVVALYEDALAQNLLAGRPLTADNEFLTEMVPRLMSGLLDWDDATGVDRPADPTQGPSELHPTQG